MLHRHKWRFVAAREVGVTDEVGRVTEYKTRILYHCTVCTKPRTRTIPGRWVPEITGAMDAHSMEELADVLGD